ncbi:MAG: MBL fold metallo-hydrolase [Erysipelotrichaceae bacterium]
MKYSVLASGSLGNATLIETNQTKILIDCGTTKKYLTQSLHNCGVKYSDIDAVFITHEHIDHIRQLSLFKNHQVYAPHPMNSAPDIITLQVHQTIMIKDLSILAIPLSHDSTLTYGYIISQGSENLVYITDTGYLKQSELDRIKDADFYIFESNHDVERLMQTNRPHLTKRRILSDEGHLSNIDSSYYLSMIVNANTKDIILAHLSLEANTERLALTCLVDTLERTKVSLHPSIQCRCAKQYEITTGGYYEEKCESYHHSESTNLECSSKL